MRFPEKSKSPYFQACISNIIWFISQSGHFKLISEILNFNFLNNIFLNRFLPRIPSEFSIAFFDLKESCVIGIFSRIFYFSSLLMSPNSEYIIFYTVSFSDSFQNFLNRPRRVSCRVTILNFLFTVNDTVKVSYT